MDKVPPTILTMVHENNREYRMLREGAFYHDYEKWYNGWIKGKVPINDD